MELKRLLTRANALLLQGAYQGAESFIEQAMAESEKLKQELAGLDTLRTRVTEMASEVERLQSVIDEANAQEHVGVADQRFEQGSSDPYEHTICKFKASLVPAGTKLYAHPIPAQQSPSACDDQGFAIVEEALKRVSCGNLAEAPFPLTGDEAKCWLNGAASAYQHALEMIVPQQSPAVAVPDEGELRRIFEEYYADDRFPIRRDAFGDYFENDQRGRTLNNDWEEWKRCRKAMLDIVSNQDAAPSPRITEHEPTELELHRGDYNACKEAGFESPGELLASYKYLLANRITEQDSREILENFCYEYNSCAGIDEWCEKEGRALLNKLNGDQND